MKHIFILLIFCCIAGLSWYYTAHPLTAKVKINRVVFTVGVAATESQKKRGLGGIKSMPEASGMLFPYNHKEQYEYWMRGMKFPLDFIWIDGNKVVDLTLNISPPVGNEQPIIVKPNVPIDKVLEVNAGVVAKNNIQIGDAVQFLDK